MQAEFAFRTPGRTRFDLVVLPGDDRPGNLGDDLLEKETEVAARPVVRRGNVIDALRVRRELVALAKAGARRVGGIVDRDRVAAVALHDREAGDVRRAVPDIDHVVKRDGPQSLGHVIVDVLPGRELSLVDPEEILGLLGVADDLLGEVDAPALVDGELAAEDGLDERAQAASIDQGLDPGRDDVMLDPHPGRLLLR
jgi:hypothetical protein